VQEKKCNRLAEEVMCFLKLKCQTKFIDDCPCNFCLVSVTCEESCSIKIQFNKHIDKPHEYDAPF
jgi:hypothetical protein